MERFTQLQELRITGPAVGLAWQGLGAAAVLPTLVQLRLDSQDPPAHSPTCDAEGFPVVPRPTLLPAGSRWASTASSCASSGAARQVIHALAESAPAVPAPL